MTLVAEEARVLSSRALSSRALSSRALCDEIGNRARQMAMAECHWLELLAEFDTRGAWAVDGQLSAVDWLVWRCGMARSTAKEKLRVAHELVRRPLIKAGFASGELSYSKVRAITRVQDASAQVDSALLALAARGTAEDLERAARHFELLHQQELGVDQYAKRFDRRGLRSWKTFDGMMVIEVVLPAEDGEELMNVLNAVAAKPVTDQPVDKASAESTLSWSQRRVDALMTLMSAGAPPQRGGDDRYTIHLVANVEHLESAATLTGEPLGGQTFRRMSCDAGIVRHLMKGRRVPLDIGTRTRVWTPAQRRAISMRDAGTCRFPGCPRTTCDIHHVVHYADGGPTSVDNGILLCPRHHTTVHELGFRMSGDPNATMTFLRPDGTVLDESGARYPSRVA